MHIGKRYTAMEFLKWTKRHIFILLMTSTIPTYLYYEGAIFLVFPWQPVALLGTAVAFIIGFKNNASYNRNWEARQIYGSIINDSRSFAYTLRDALDATEYETVKRMFYRHFAWLTALRFQLREIRNWENTNSKVYKEYQSTRFTIPEANTDLQQELKQYLSEADLSYIVSKKNIATQLSALQSEELSKLLKSNSLNNLQWSLIQQCIIRLTDHQGKAERIKNFPYPRNFSSIATYLLRLFVFFMPFALLKEMDKLGINTVLEGYTLWFNIPFTTTVCWAFYTLDAVGESSVNPFEGSSNDVPITQLSRSIEIDMREMLNETTLPESIAPINNIVL